MTLTSSISSEDLLELSLEQHKLNNSKNFEVDFLCLYVEKLHLEIAVLVSSDTSVKTCSPTIFRDFPFEEIWGQLKNSPEGIALELSEIHYYSFSLWGDLKLLLGTHRPFSEFQIRKIKEIIAQLEQTYSSRKEREHLQLLQYLIKHSSDAIQIAEESGQLFYINEIASQRLGISQENCNAFHVHDFELKFSDINAWNEHVESLKKVKEIIIEGENINHETGDSFPVEVTAKLINIENRPYVMAISRDISQRKEADRHLQKEIRLQELLIDIAATYINPDLTKVDETIHDSLCKMGSFINADRAYIFEYDFVDQTTSNIHEWCREGISSEKERLQNIPLSSLPQWVNEHRQNRPFYLEDISSLTEEKDQNLREILDQQGIKSLIAVPMVQEGALLGFVGFDCVRQTYHFSEKDKDLLFLFGQMLVNITSRRQWEQTLRLQEEKFRNITAHMNLGLLEVDLNDRVLFVNQSFCDMSGYSEDELIGEQASEVITILKGKEQIHEKNKLREEGISDNYEIKILNKKGEERWWLISGAANYNDKGQSIGSIGIHLDITNQKKLEKELAHSMAIAEAAAKAKELFLANMSHEIRTPLNVIIGMIRQLNKENLTAQQFFYVKQSESSARHLLAILNNILDLAKIDSGELQMVNAEASLSAIMQNVHSIMSSQAAERNLEFALEIDPDILPALWVDEARLRQVLINLVGNAIKFTDQGRVSINCQSLGLFNERQRVRIEVSDTGIGMSDEFLAKIFDKFSQEQNASNRRFEGTGLGMAISKDLVSLMGGELQVRSQKGEGSGFWFTLDLEIGKPENLITGNLHAEAGHYRGYKVLLVEDNDMNRFIACRSLEYLGFEIMQAVNGAIALDLIEKHSFDLILMDIQMPVMDGLTATTLIRNELKLQVPIIALTANAFKQDIDRYLAAGMDDFITKPYDEQDLFLKLSQILQRKELNEDIRVVKKTESPKPEIQAYNLDYLNELGNGDQEFVTSMIKVFCKLVAEETEVLRKALQSDDLTTLNKTAHKLKSNIDYLNINVLKQKIRDLENHTDIKNAGYKELTLEIIETLSAVRQDMLEKYLS